MLLQAWKPDDFGAHYDHTTEVYKGEDGFPTRVVFSDETGLINLNMWMNRFFSQLVVCQPAHFIWQQAAVPPHWNLFIQEWLPNCWIMVDRSFEYPLDPGNKVVDKWYIKKRHCTKLTVERELYERQIRNKQD